MHAIDRAQTLVGHLKEGNERDCGIEVADANGKSSANVRIFVDAFFNYW